MKILCVIAVILLLTVQNALRKQYNQAKEPRGSFTFSAVGCLFALMFFVVSSRFSLDFKVEILPYALGFAASYGTAVIFSFLAIKHGSLSLSSLISSYSLIVPTLFGIAFLGEEQSATLYIGLLALCISLLLVNLKKTKEDKKINVKWVIFVALGFLGNGICSSVQVLQQRAFDGLYKNELMVMALSFVVPLLFIVAFFTERDLMLASIKKGGLLMAGNGLANGLTNLLVMMAVSVIAMNSSVFYPLVSSGSVILTSAIAIFYYGEKFTRMQYLGIASGVVAVVFLNI